MMREGVSRVRVGRCAGAVAALFAATVAVGAVLSGCEWVDAVCGDGECRFSERSWSLIESLANLPPPDPDPANKYVGNADAELLGQQLYFDVALSGVATQVDGLGRASPPARSAKGVPTQIACVSCHDPASGGSDHESVPGYVSVGAGWYDVNSMPTVNSAYYKVKYWNGRYDSLVWQAMAVMESPFSMNGTRLAVAWRIHDAYLATYNQIFGAEHPFPFPAAFDEITAESFQDQALAAKFRCSSVDECPAETCRLVATSTLADVGRKTCVPRFPLAGKSNGGGCNVDDPEHDPFDCMAPEDQEAITRVYVNVAKAIAAYEYLLVSRNSLFDRWVAEGPDSDLISSEARHGAALFVGKASCIDCHNTPLFSDNDFHNIGVPYPGAPVPTVADCPEGDPRCDCVTPKNCQPWGAFTGLGKLQAGTEFRIDGVKWSDDPEDRSRADYYVRPIDDTLKGAWRTPGLRDVALTAPYMHNGVYKTLLEVVRHYDEGGTNEGVAPEWKSKRLAPLALSEDEANALVEFLKTLTGEPLPASLVRPVSPTP
ncbi:MAG: hypothetical protein H6729_14955 [Deltaproteobacteria bacterium]|nr:hypothetical protein [Deltaproteobacteria bacterium]